MKTAEGVSIGEADSHTRHGAAATYLPAFATVHALTEGGHRLISTAGLSLAVADLLLLAVSALELLADTLLGHGDLGLVHVLLLEHGDLLTLLGRQELLRGHADKALGRDLARHDALAQGGVGLALEVGEERADLVLVGLGGAAEQLEGGVLDLEGALEHELGRLVAAVGQAVVEGADAAVARRVASALGVDLLGCEGALLGVTLELAGGRAAARRRGVLGCRRGRLGRGRGRRRRLAALGLNAGLLLGLDALAPSRDNVLTQAGDIAVGVLAELGDEDTGLGGL